MTEQTGTPLHHARTRIAAMLLTGLAAVGVMAARAEAPLHDDWGRFLATGDTLQALGADGRTPPVAHLQHASRVAYLLAFHQAQDARDVPRMLTVADRLERLGELGLGRHVRRVSRAIAAESGWTCRDCGRVWEK